MSLVATSYGALLIEGEESMDKERETMTEADFAKAVGVSRVTLWRMRQRGQLPHYKLGRRILYGQRHVEEFSRAHECKSEVSEHSEVKEDK
jgi:excisionase family DNA binding protein